LVLRLLDRGFKLVADDRVEIEHGVARPPVALAGLIEVRGLGLLRVPFVPAARLALVVDVAARIERLPAPARHAALDLPLIAIDPAAASAPQRVALGLDCALGRVGQVAGAFAA
jgi:HPr kinase/phosphorylase